MIDCLNEIIGLHNQKEEINCLINWFIDSDKYLEKGYMIPKGLLLYGDPGNGKTFIIKNIEKALKDKNDVIVKKLQITNLDNVIEDLNIFFDIEEDGKKYILAIDELDLLLGYDDARIRCLQEKMDGLNTQKNIFVIATSNDIEEISDALLRKGRFDRKIKIGEPHYDEIVEYVDYLSQKLNFQVQKNEKDIYYLFIHFSYIDIKTVINECLLRYGPENVTYDNICLCLRNLDYDYIKEKEINDIKYIHEAGHCVMGLAFPNNIKVSKIIMNYNVGSTTCESVNNFTYDTSFIKIMICCAGNIAEKIITKTASLGSDDDFEKASYFSHSLIKLGYKGVNKMSPLRFDFHSNKMKTMIESHASKILKKAERIVRKYLARHKSLLFEIAAKIKEKEYLTSEEIASIASQYQKDKHCSLRLKKFDK